jgi:UDP:flavonoid glycosyltransferase YjiC (YdhE family)
MRFVFTILPTNDLGLLTRSLPIAKELTERGHYVAFCNPERAPRILIAEAGFDNLLPRHPLYNLDLDDLNLSRLYRLARSDQLKREYGSLLNFARELVSVIPTRFAPRTAEVWSMDHGGAIAGMLNENFVRSNCDALKELMLNCQTDVVVDFWNPFACIAARAAKKPLVSVIQADAHPAGRGFIWWRKPPPDVPTPTPILNRVLAGYGLPPIGKLEELSVGDLTLVMGMPETDPLPETADVTYVGPILWQKPGAELPDWVHELSRDKPVIWVYPGNPRYMPKSTPMDSMVVLHTCIKALADQDVQVVLTTGHHALPKESLPLPANFRHAPFVPGLAMAERADLLIHHGGYGSCQTGLYTGTPAVIIPTFSERESNARRTAAAGAGDFIVPIEGESNKREVNVDELRAKVMRVLSDPSFAANARRIGEKAKTYRGAPQAAHLIEGFAQEVQ